MPEKLDDESKARLALLQAEFSTFDFSPLMRDTQEQSGLAKFLPIIAIVLLVINIIATIAK